MNNRLTEKEKELLGQMRPIMRYMSVERNVALSSREKIAEIYKHFWQLCEKVGDEENAQKCKELFEAFQNPNHYIECVETAVNEVTFERWTTVPDRIKVYYHLLNACIEAGQQEKAESYKKQIEALLAEEGDDNEKMIAVDAHRKTFNLLLGAKFRGYSISGDHFLLDPLEDAELTYDMAYKDEKIYVSGRFLYTFREEQSAQILKKKSVLNKTFKDIGLNAFAKAEIGVESIEEGVFSIVLRNEEFVIKDDNYSNVIDYMLRFMEVVTIIQNTESCE